MDCADCQELIQRYLDGEPPLPALTAHLCWCTECRSRYAAAQCLLDGLSFVAPPRPPVGLPVRICRQVLTEQRRAERVRRLAWTSALAAGLLLACGVAYRAQRAALTETGPAPLAMASQATAPLPSLNRSIEEAGLAVVRLTRRTADETLDQTKLLLPMNIPQASLGSPPQLSQVLDPPAQSLRQIQESMSAGLEPVATSARRAVGLFLHEIPTSVQ